jgi:mannose-6-phosphate isomerase
VSLQQLARPLRLVPDPRRRPWGGSRLGEPQARKDGSSTEPVGELWLAGPATRVALSVGAAGGQPRGSRPAAGPTLDDLVGTAGIERYGARFPLLAKLIDAAGWLSLQVHPDDRLAVDLEGPAAVGKHEAWYVVDADPGALLIVGTAPQSDPDAVAAAVAAGSVPDGLLETVAATVGDIHDIRPGVLHAIGPGVLLYEIQQPSDITYRVHDWGRPATPDRPLHIAQSLRCLDPRGRATTVRAADRDAGPATEPDARRATGREAGAHLETGDFRLLVTGAPTRLRPEGRSVYIVAALDGPAAVTCSGGVERLAPRDAVVVPACVADADVTPEPGTRVAIASLP